MYTETKKAGIKQYFFALLSMLFLYIIWFSLQYLQFPKTPRVILVFILCCFTAYKVYIKYTMEYTFTLDKKALTARMSGGRRADEIKIPYKNIVSIQQGGFCRKFFGRRVFSVSILPCKNYCNIIYNKGKNTLSIEVSKDFCRELSERIS